MKQAAQLVLWQETPWPPAQMRYCAVTTYSHDEYSTVATMSRLYVALTLRGAAKLKENDFQSISVRELRFGLYWSTNFSHETILRVILYVRTLYVFTCDIQGLRVALQLECNLKCAKLGSTLENPAIRFSESPPTIFWKLG